MLFNEVIGQHAVKQHLYEMVLHNRLSHALLFLGKEGSGALPLALAFAQYIISLPPKAAVVEDLFGGFSSVEPQGPILPNDIATQPAYLRANSLQHPDLHFTFPVIPKKSGDKPKSNDYIQEWREFIKLYPYGNVFDWLQSIGAENKQGNISAEECNEIIKQLSLKSFESTYKILLLWMPEYLGKEGNKLLKLIEEPPPNTLFFLVAENEEQILPTILSRCQLVKVPSLETADIAKALIERSGVNTEMANQIAGIAEGNFREALQIVQHADADWHELLREWLNVTLKGGPIAQMQFVEDIAKTGREKQKQFLKYFNHLLAQSLRVRIFGPENVLMNDAEKEMAIRLNKVISVSQQNAIVKEIDKAMYFVERNANGKMLFTALTLKLYHIIKNNITLDV
ncbi:MAG: ATP-binding protein [Chitinophagaceae bacterium]